MTIYYLYVKTHNITGLKYLGYTKRKDPYKYKGSGDYWTKHINKHGYDVTTEILKECSTKQEIKEWGIYYSSLWNIVEERDENGNKMWANLKPENGDGGFLLSPEQHSKGVLTRKNNGSYKNSTESIAKRKKTMEENGTTCGQTPESIAKNKATRLANGTAYKNNDPDVISKQLATKKKNGTLNNNTTDSIKKGIETRRKNNSYIVNGDPAVLKKKQDSMENNKKGHYNIVQCGYCLQFVGLPVHNRHHGDKCRLRQQKEIK